MEDKYLWLEDLEGNDAIEWVKAKNEKSVQKIKNHSWFSEIENYAFKIFSSADKIPYVSISGEYIYNLWKDEIHVQGLYRRAKIEEYLKVSPSWEWLLDLDDLSKKENEKWVFTGFELSPDSLKALVSLSPGGSDSDIIREFDMEKKEFIANGFRLPKSKGRARWIDNNTIRFNRAYAEDYETDSGYARIVCDWKRGESLESARQIFKINKTDVLAYLNNFRTKNQEYYFLGRSIDYYNSEELVLKNGIWNKLNLPTMFENFGVVDNLYIVMIKEDWKQFKIGDVVAYDLDNHECKKIFSAKINGSINEVKTSKTGLYVILDEDVKGGLYKITLTLDGSWLKVKIKLPENGTLGNLATDYQSDKFFVSYSSFNKPTTYYYGEGTQILCAAKISTSFFDHENVVVEQKFSTSLDGTQIPYFLAYKRDIKFDGTNPTILYGYGGFEESMKPYFSNTEGASWIERGGVFALANIRGGGEYGPRWHQAAVKEKRHKSYEDFFSVAEDLINKKITSCNHLGATGESNGGLLMGVCYIQRPELFAAISCEAPLLDMHKYHHLFAGASWIAEYGNPDDETDGAYIKAISPYQNIKKEGKYPAIFLSTSTDDDRVHPGHARKFAARLEEFAHRFYYYENGLGGHAGASSFKEAAFLHALQMCFFWEHLK